MRDRHSNKLAWKVCPGCGTTALVLLRSMGFCSVGCAHTGENSASLGRVGEQGFRWRGDDAGYVSMHKRVYRLRGKADHCTKCGISDPAVRYQWANLTGNFNDPDDYASMCPKCHRQYDAASILRGESHPMAKLTADMVREARARYAAGDGTTVSLAREYGVTQGAMYGAIKGITWKHLT